MRPFWIWRINLRGFSSFSTLMAGLVYGLEFCVGQSEAELMWLFVVCRATCVGTVCLPPSAAPAPGVRCPERWRGGTSRSSSSAPRTHNLSRRPSSLLRLQTWGSDVPDWRNATWWLFIEDVVELLARIIFIFIMSQFHVGKVIFL